MACAGWRCAQHEQYLDLAYELAKTRSNRTGIAVTGDMVECSVCLVGESAIAPVPSLTDLRMNWATQSRLPHLHECVR